MKGTPAELLPLIAAGSQVIVRDEQWIVRSTQQTPSDGVLVRCIGTSTLVKDTEATFVTNLDHVEPLRPEDTVLVPDVSPNFRRSRLYLEAVIRKTPVPARETALAVSHQQLLNRLEYQRRATHKAFTGLRPRLLIADAVGLGKTLEVGLDSVRTHPPRSGREDPRRHSPPHTRTVPARALDPVRHPAGPARLRRHPASPSPDPCQPQPVHPLQTGDHLDRHAEERRALPPPPRGHPVGCGRHRRVPQPRQPRHAQQSARPGACPPHRGAAPHQRHTAQRRPEELRRTDPSARPDGHRRSRQADRRRHQAPLRAPAQDPRRGRRRGR